MPLDAPQSSHTNPVTILVEYRWQVDPTKCQCSGCGQRLHVGGKARCVKKGDCDAPKPVERSAGSNITGRTRASRCAKCSGKRGVNTGTESRTREKSKNSKKSTKNKESKKNKKSGKKSKERKLKRQADKNKRKSKKKSKRKERKKSKKRGTWRRRETRIVA
jgi:hypothetical protein